MNGKSFLEEWQSKKCAVIEKLKDTDKAGMHKKIKKEDRTGYKKCLKEPIMKGKEKGTTVMKWVQWKAEKHEWILRY